MIHELKTEREYFEAIVRGDKTFEVRENDRQFKVNDELLLKEISLSCSGYTGRVLHRRISYILPGGSFGIDENYVVMGLQKI